MNDWRGKLHWSDLGSPRTISSFFFSMFRNLNYFQVDEKSSLFSCPFVFANFFFNEFIIRFYFFLVRQWGERAKKNKRERKNNVPMRVIWFWLNFPLSYPMPNLSLSFLLELFRYILFFVVVLVRSQINFNYDRNRPNRITCSLQLACNRRRERAKKRKLRSQPLVAHAVKLIHMIFFPPFGSSTNFYSCVVVCNALFNILCVYAPIFFSVSLILTHLIEMPVKVCLNVIAFDLFASSFICE